MKEDLKKSAAVFLYKCVVSVCVFGILVITGRFFPSFREKIIKILTLHTDFNEAGKALISLFSELVPFLK